MAGKIRLGELLVRAGVLDEVKLKAALAEQQRWGGRLGRILVDMNFVSEDLLTKALSKQLGFPRATFLEMNIPASVLAKVPADFARSNACCPEHFDGARKLLTVAMADPTNVPVADELRFKTGLRVEATIAGEQQISRAIDQLYGTRSGGYAAQLPDAIDLPPDGDNPVFAPSPAYIAAMAASGLTVDAEGSPRLAPAAPPMTAPAARPMTAPAARPRLAPAARPMTAPAAPPMTAPRSAMSPPPLGPVAPLAPGASAPATGPAPSLPPVAPTPQPGGPLPQTSPSGPLSQSTGPLDLNLNLTPGPVDIPGRGNGHLLTGHTPSMPVSSVQGTPGGPPATDGVARRLEAAQRKQLRAVQVMIDLLIEKGVFTRDEFAQLINRRGH